MKEAKVCTDFKSDIALVWDIITNYKDFSWREGIRSSESIDDHCYYETDVLGQKTVYKILEKKEHEIYKISMENNKTKSEVLYTFIPKETGCEVQVHQYTEFKNALTGLFAGSLVDMGKLQLRYLYTVKKTLGEL